MFFTAVNPMYPDQDLEKVKYDLDKPRIAVRKNTWRIHQNTVCWCNLKLGQRKGLQFYQTRSLAIATFNTLPAICVEKVVHMKTGEDKNCSVYQSPSRTHAEFASWTLESFSSRSENPSTIKANKARSTRKLVARISRTLVESISKKITERSEGKLVAVTLITEVKVYFTQQFRKMTLIVKGLTEQFENHPNRDSLIEDMDKTEEFNPFSEKSKELITSVGNTE